MTRVADLTDRVMTVGPKQGFEMRYTVDIMIHRTARPDDDRLEGVAGDTGSDRVSESRSDEALRNESNFRRMLVAAPPRRNATITIWTYPDSFAEYRMLNEELHRLGYATAGRPLPKGFPIGGSPQGSKSAAQ